MALLATNVSPRLMRVVLFAVILTLSLFYLGYQRPAAVWDTGRSLMAGSTQGKSQDSAQRPIEDRPQRPSAEPWKAHAGDRVGETGEQSTEKLEDLPAVDDVASPVTPVTVSPPAASLAMTSEATSPSADCVSFQSYMRTAPGPKSEGKREFPLVRPPPECRTFRVPAVDEYITKMKGVIKDPDLYRLFENSFPNTLDTMVKWHGYANKTLPTVGAGGYDAQSNEAAVEESVVTDEELTYVITGDIDAMWLRDSASQVNSYLHFLEPSEKHGTLASLWRGLINSHSRYVIISPYCHSFQPPPESGIPPTHNGAYSQNNPQPPYDPKKTFDCKWELDSLASFLQISVGYYEKTKDISFFAKYTWIDAVEAAVKAAGAMRKGTYDEDGHVQKSAFTFTGYTNRGSETLTNDGLGNPVRENGMVRTAFRPSDDATIFQLLTPANMMWAKYLEEAALIMDELKAEDARAAGLVRLMREQALGIREGIDKDAITNHHEFGDIFAYECDGYGGVNLMDDANIPSLLAMPLWDYAHSSHKLPQVGEGHPERNYSQIYQNTRRFILSSSNPYYAKGPVLSAVGGPHLGPGKGWPMAAITAAMTALESNMSGLESDELVKEVVQQLGMVLDSTTATGVVHESVNAWAEQDYTREWFGWANGLLGELVVKLEEFDRRREGDGILGRSWQ